MRKRALLAWSSGKDSAWALHVLRQQADLEVVGLLTTVNQVADRVAMHAVRSELLRAQAAAARLPLHVVNIPWPCSNEQYEVAMAAAVERARADDVSVMAFGDLFLEDIRNYRLAKLSGTEIEARFPLWGRPTAALAREMLAGGLRARLSCVDPKQLAASFAGREFDSALLAELPASVDPCGENGEFHTFVHAGPMFQSAIDITNGERVERDGFVFHDLLLSQNSAPE